MSAGPTGALLAPRSPRWKWYVCGILLLATMLNYMDRLTLNLTASQIKAALAAQKTGGEGLVGDRGAGEFLRERIFAVGAKFHWNEMLRRATGEGLTAKYFVREFVG